MSHQPSDNRQEIIQKAKEHLLRATNIESSKPEMQVIDNILFRCWQMGWLRQYENDYAASELIITMADNGMMVEAFELVQVIEDTHVENGTDKNKLLQELGKIFYGEINEAIKATLANKIRVRLEIAKEE